MKNPPVDLQRAVCLVIRYKYGYNPQAAQITGICVAGVLC